VLIFNLSIFQILARSWYLNGSMQTEIWRYDFLILICFYHYSNLNSSKSGEINLFSFSELCWQVREEAALDCFSANLTRNNNRRRCITHQSFWLNLFEMYVLITGTSWTFSLFPALKLSSYILLSFYRILFCAFHVMLFLLHIFNIS
jgi:hypothetical protein